MNILQIDVSVNHGSTGRIAEEIGKKVLARGWQSTIAYGRYANPSVSNTIKIGNRFSQLMHLIQTRLFDTHGLGSKNTTLELISRIKELDPDIIHLHQIHGYYIHYPALFRYLINSQKKVVWTLHDCWAYTGHCCHYIRVNCTKFITECDKCPLKGRYPQSWMYDNSKNNFYLKKNLLRELKNITLTPVSDWMSNETRKSFLKDKTIETIHNGIDIHKFTYTDPNALRLKHGLNGKKIVLGVASPWSDLKGLSDFLSLAKLIPSEWKILLVGLTKSQIDQLPSNIVGVERVNGAGELAMYYSVADVFVSLSKAESFGLVSAEAMACGTPVIAYDVTANPEIVIQGTGYVVPVSNIDEILIKAKLVIQNGKNHYSSKCRLNVETNFNQEIQFGKYLELYENLI